MPDYKKLDVWTAAHALVLDVYRQTSAFPRTELFGLTSQIRRAAVSVPANLAEGCGRGTQRELARFAAIALGSTNELEYLLVLAKDLAYLEDESLAARARAIARQLTRLRQSVNRHSERANR
jgi:four helix bundle protein